jgi:hypothetical protein
VGVRVGGNEPSVITFSGNDIYNNTGFELRNESGISITMENVYLGKLTATEFGKQDNLTRIYDQRDHPTYGQVVVQSLNTGTMLLPPEIITQPQGFAVNLGGSLTLSVAATGTGPFTYKWYRNGSVISGATGTSLTLSGFDLSKEGSYHVVVKNVVDQVASEVAQVTAIIPGGGTTSVPPNLGLGRLSGYSTVSISGQVGWSYTIQFSDDMKNWKTLQVLTLTENPQIYIDWGSLGKTQRFYRTVWSE